jgi:hypothetical protein
MAAAVPEVNLAELMPVGVPFACALEPTHVVVVGDLESVRHSVRNSLLRLGAIDGEVRDSYEVWFCNSPLCFSVNYKRQGERETCWVVEFRKWSGCTVDFVEFYVTCLTLFRDMAESEPPGLVLDPESAEERRKWLETRQQYNTRLPPMLLINHVGSLDETLSPVLAMLTSPWQTSQFEGLKTVAELTETLSNATVLASYRPLLDALDQMDVKRWRSRHMCRCFARVTANLVSAPVLDQDVLTTFKCLSLARRIEEAHLPHRGNPLWHHVAIEVARLTNGTRHVYAPAVPSAQ